MSRSETCRRTWRFFAEMSVIFLFSLFSAFGHSSWFYRAWQANEGLPDNTVVGVAQAPDGFLWVATQSGLVRFDGLSFHQYPLTAEAGLATSLIDAILPDRRGRLWLATSGGRLLCLEAGRIRAFSPADGLPKLRAMVMAEDGEGAIWISYGGGRLIRFIQGYAIDFTAALEVSGTGCRINSDKLGQLWFAKDGQVGLFRQGRFLKLFRLEANIMRVAASRSSGVWICADRVLYKYTEGGVPVKLGELPTSLSHVKPTDIFEDHTGAVWIGTEQAGIFRYAGGGFTKMETSQHEIWSVTEDREGSIWVGTRGGGLNRLLPSAVELLDVGSAVPFDAVQSVSQSANGDLWAVTRDGALARKHGDNWRAMSIDDGWPGLNASCVASAPDGGLWVGTKWQGLNFWHPGGIPTNLTQVAGLGSCFVRSLFVMPSGEVWIGTEGPDKLERMRNGMLEDFPLPIDSGPICAMTLDAAGTFWAASANGLLLRLNQDRLVNETPNTLSVQQPIQCLATTSDGSLWIGYGGNGLGRLNANHFAHIRVEQGLFEDQISQISPDGRGRIWLAGNKGIFHLREKEFDDVVEHRIPAVFSVVLGPDSGTPGLQTSRGYWPGALLTAQGELMIPKATGLAVVHAEKLLSSSPSLPAVLDRVVVDGQTVAAYDPVDSGGSVVHLESIDQGQSSPMLRLSPKHKQVRFEYTALNFADPQNVRFKYKLKGLDEDWVEAQDRRMAYYSQLPPGDYLFKVAACNPDGVWSESRTALSISISAPFWQTWWFRIMVSSSVLAAIAIMVRAVEKRRMKLQFETAQREHVLERERARIAKDIHDDLGASLTEISLLSEIAQRVDTSPQEIRADVRQIGAMARALTVSLSEIVWAVNPRNDTVESFVTYACNYAQDYLQRVGIRCRLEMPAELPNLVITSELRHNLFLVIKEALNNIVKHAQANEVRLCFTLENGEFKLIIKDNGKGIHPLLNGAHPRNKPEKDAPGVARGNGVVNMRERVEKMGGRFDLSNLPSGGTQLELTVPYERVHQK